MFCFNRKNTLNNENFMNYYKYLFIIWLWIASISVFYIIFVSIIIIISIFYSYFIYPLQSNLASTLELSNIVITSYIIEKKENLIKNCILNFSFYFLVILLDILNIQNKKNIYEISINHIKNTGIRWISNPIQCIRIFFMKNGVKNISRFNLSLIKLGLFISTVLFFIL